MKQIKTFYFSGRQNAGDLFGPWILDNMGFQPIYDKQCPNICICGSILQSAFTKNAKIWGCGFMSNAGTLHAKPENVYAVRGKLTADIIKKQTKKSVLTTGDPGILASKFYYPSSTKKFKYGIIPHYVDLDFFSQLKDPNVKIINICTNNFENLFEEINECEFILSSSLHGIIFSHSFSIPSLHIEHNDLIDTTRFKFKDYYSNFNLKYETLKINNLSDLNFSEIDEKYFSHKDDYKPTSLEIETNQKNLLMCFPFELSIVSGVKSQFLNWTPLNINNKKIGSENYSNRIASDVVLMEILNAVKNKLPYSIVRFGDGEFTCIKKALKIPSKDLTKEWSQEVSDGKIKKTDIDNGTLGKKLISAIKNANLIGITLWNGFDDRWSYPKEIETIIKSKKTCSPWLSMEWRSNGCMDTLVNQCTFSIMNKNANQCMAEIEKYRCKDNRFKTKLKNHGRFPLNGNFNEAEKYIKNTHFNVYLVSCGPAGKLWITEMAKKYNKVIIDVGHQMARTWSKP